MCDSRRKISFGKFGNLSSVVEKNFDWKNLMEAFDMKI